MPQKDFRTSGNSAPGKGWEPYRANIQIPRVKLSKKHLGCSPKPPGGWFFNYNTKGQARLVAKNGRGEVALRCLWGLFGELFGESFGVFWRVFGGIPGSPSGTLWEASGVSLGASWERSGGGPCYAIIKVFFCTGGGCNMSTYEVQVKKVVKKVTSKSKQKLLKNAKNTPRSEKIP